MRIISLAAVMLFAISAAGKDIASELTVRHVGQYAAVPWQKPGAPIPPGSRDDRVRDLNFSVASVNLRDDLPEESLRRWREQPQPGKTFLPRVHFWDGEDRFKGPMRDIEVYWKRLDRYLDAMNLADFQGIVLAEENVSYSGRPEVLTELYRRVKAKYRVAVWQWWSPSSSLPESGGWIPADGWVIDPYFMPNPAFRRFVRKYLITGLPLVIMPWASTGEKSPPLTPQQWKANNEQLDVAVEFNLPVAFYWTYGRGNAGTSCNFGGDRGAIRTEWDKINHWVWDYIDRVRKIPADYSGLPSADEGTGDVLEIAPNREGKLLYADDFSTARSVDDASMSGFRDLLLDGKTLSARGFRGRRVDAALTYKFAGDYIAQHPRASVTVPPGSGGDRRVEIALSADGKTWPHRATSSGAAQQVLTVSSHGDASFASLRSFWVRLRLVGDAGSREKPNMSVDDLRIEAAVPAPRDAAVTLNPVADEPGKLFYEDNFRTEKYLSSTRRTGDDRLEWSEGQLAVRLRPGGSKPELVWRVKTAAPVQGVVVEATGRANNGSLGTNHYLDVSLDGKNWLHEQNTVGRPHNISGWASHGLRIDLQTDPRFRGVREFCVRLRMQAGGYKEIHRSRSGIVNKIRIEASATAPAAAELHFQRHDIADYPNPYQVAAADINADGKPDVLALSTQGNRVDWFENPSWRQHPIARTDQNIDLAPFDLDGNGKPGIALASGFYFADGNRGGEIQWLTPGLPDQLWKSLPIARDPVVHRLRWGDLDGDGRAELVLAPIFGPGSKGPAQAKPSHLWAFRPPKRLGDPWEKWAIDETLTVIHGLYVGDLDGDGRDELLTASFEGVQRFDWDEGRWRKLPIAAGAPPVSNAPGAARGSSDVVPVKIGQQRMHLAAIEPWHGHQLVVYAPGADATSWRRQLLDDSMQEGHALLAADFDGDGRDEIVAGWRRGGGGIKLFHCSPEGTSWRPTTIERGVAVEGAAAADVNGDGKLDIVASGGRNNKILWYENK